MSSPILKDQAIVLRFFPVSNTSRVVSWLTRDHGRISTLIKGAQRPKSQFIGQFDLFYTCELLFYARAREELHHTKECSPLSFRAGLRNDWRATTFASYAADLIARSTPTAAANPQLFELFEALLDELANHGLSHALPYWFELQILDTLGLSPQLDRCTVTDAPAPPDRRFSVARGGLITPHVDPRTTGTELELTQAALDHLRTWKDCRDPAMFRDERLGRRLWRELRDCLGPFLRHHLELPLESRTLAFDLLERNPNGAVA